MKKGMKKLALLTAAVVCLAMGPQSAAPVEAASVTPRTTFCSECDRAMTIKIVPTVELIRTGTCTDRSHASLGCYICTVQYVDIHYTVCSNCGETETGRTTGTAISGQHSCEVGK